LVEDAMDVSNVVASFQPPAAATSLERQLLPLSCHFAGMHATNRPSNLSTPVAASAPACCCVIPPLCNAELEARPRARQGWFPGQ
jgi:hypothetical protein